MRVRKPRYPVGTKVRARLKQLRGHRLKRGEIGVVESCPRTIRGDYTGYSHVDFPSVPGCAVMAEGLLFYRPRKKKAQQGC